jgi:hypothetical protein
MSPGLIDFPITAIARLIVKILGEGEVRISLSPLGGVSAAVRLPALERSIDQRLEKINHARDNLREALAAVDELQDNAEESRKSLATVTAALAKAEQQEAALNAKLDSLRQLRNVDVDIARDVFGIPNAVDKWRERIWGFLFGILAGLLVTVGWELALKPFLEKNEPQLFQTSPTNLAPALHKSGDESK